MIWNEDGCNQMRLVLLEPPLVEPLTAAEAKARLNIGSDVSDEVIDAYIMASRQVIDGAVGWLNRALITQKWQGQFDGFPFHNGSKIYIPLPPLQSLTISYLDSTGAMVPMTDGVDYRLVQAQRPYVLPITSWPTISGLITFEFVVGYGNAGSDVPEPIRTAIALGVGHLRSMSMRNLTVVQEIEEGVGATRYLINADIRQIIDDTVASLLSVYRVIAI